MQRGIEESDANGSTFESLVESFKVSLLHGKDLCKSLFSFLNGLGADHFAECVNSAFAEEHMLGTAQTYTFGTQFTGFLRVSGSIGIGSDLKLSVFIGPAHDSSEFACDGSVNGGDDSIVNVTGGAVDAQPVTFMIGLASKNELLVFFIHIDRGATGYAAGTHAAGNNCSVRGHTAANGQNTLSCLHAFNIFGRGFKTDQDNLLAAGLPVLCILCGEYDLTASRAGGSRKSFCNGQSRFKSLGVKLGMEQCVEVSGVNHKNSFLFGLLSFVDQVAGDLQSGLSGTLTVTGLKHVELAVLNGELHILHIVVVIFKSLANVRELSESFGEQLSHLFYLERSTDAGNNVLALCIGEEFAHEVLFAGGGVTGERNAGTAIIAHVTECHHLNVDGSAPGIGDIVVTTVNVCSGVVPGTEDRFDGGKQLLLGIGGEIFADLCFVFSLELACESLEVFSVELYILSNALLLFHLVDEFFKVLLADFHNDVGEHLDKTSVAVPSPSGVVGLFSQGVDNFFVKAEVEDGVHHAGHGSSCAGTYGNKQRILLVAELLAGDLLHLCDVFHDLSLDLIVDLSAVFVVLGAGFGGDGEALRYRQTDVGHFRKVSAFAAEKLTHVCVALGKEVNILLCHFLLSS